MSKVVRLTEQDLVKKVINEQLVLGAIDNMALINNIKYKLKAWAGGLLGYQPVQIKGLKILPDGSAELNWYYDGLIKQSGKDIIPKQKVEEIIKVLRTQDEYKLDLPNGKTVKLVKA